MINNILNKIKPFIKDLYPQCISIYNSINKKLKPLSKITFKKYKKNFKDISSLLTEQWKIIGLGLSLFLLIYYGIGAAISSKLNNSLETEIKVSKTSPTYLGNTLSNIIKSQIDDTAWTPSLPAFFPASILDNLPNFQLGVKNSLNYILKKLAKHYNNLHLEEATQLLDYPADIWLFSQTNDKLSPGSAKQYRKAISHIVDFSTNLTNSKSNTDDLLIALNSLSSLLQMQIKILEKQVQEYHSDFWDFNSDNLFYQAQGSAYTTYYILNALQKDNQDIIVNSNQYENLTTALMFLSKAVKLNPTIIKNSSLENTYAANHLMYLAYYISQAQNNLQKIYYNINKTEGAIKDAN